VHLSDVILSENNFKDLQSGFPTRRLVRGTCQILINSDLPLALKIPKNLVQSLHHREHREHRGGSKPNYFFWPFSVSSVVNALLINTDFPLALKIVIPEEILIGSALLG